MAQELPQEKLIVGLASFGLGLILSGRFLFGLLPIAAAVYVYVKNRAAYADLKKRLTGLLGAEKTAGVNASPQQTAHKAHRPEAVASTPSAPPDNWYYERAGAAIGPFKESDIRSLLLNREITSVTLVYNPIFGDEWRKLENTHFAEIAKGRPS